jgi:hypothetical protein
VAAKGRRNQTQIRWESADCCEQCGVIRDRRMGGPVMYDLANPGPSRYHASGYGFSAAKPFRRKRSWPAGEASIDVKPGDKHRGDAASV